jgi:hypothetical protein
MYRGPVQFHSMSDEYTTVQKSSRVAVRVFFSLAVTALSGLSGDPGLVHLQP